MLVVSAACFSWSERVDSVCCERPVKVLPKAGCHGVALSNAVGRRGGRPVFGGGERFPASGCREAGQPLPAATPPYEPELDCALIGVGRSATCGQHELGAHAGDLLPKAKAVCRQEPKRACVSARRHPPFSAHWVSAGGGLRSGACEGPRFEDVWRGSREAEVTTSVNDAPRGGTTAAGATGTEAHCADAAAMGRGGSCPEHRWGGAQLAASVSRSPAPGAWK